MEKISIVQRRRDRSREIETAALIRARQREEMRQQVYDYMDDLKSKAGVVSLGPVEEFSHDPDNLDLILSKEQSNELNGILHLEELINGTTEEANVKIFRNEQNQIVFRFTVQHAQQFEMLTSEDVCHMLKISRKTLYKNVHDNIIPGFKIGTQLRFLVDDILSYLNENRVNN